MSIPNAHFCSESQLTGKVKVQGTVGENESDRAGDVGRVLEDLEHDGRDDVSTARKAIVSQSESVDGKCGDVFTLSRL